jgi:hypothetical protein
VVGQVIIALAGRLHGNRNCLAGAFALIIAHRQFDSIIPGCIEPIVEFFPAGTLAFGGITIIYKPLVIGNGIAVFIITCAGLDPVA